MRPNHLVGILLVSVFSWLIIIYILLLDRTNHTLNFISSSPKSTDELVLLEQRIKSEYESNSNFIKFIKKVLENQLEEKAALEEKEKEKGLLEEDKLLLNKLMPLSNNGAVAVLVFSCNRVTVTRCLDQLIKYRPSPLLFPIIVSQDCQHDSTDKAIQRYNEQVFHIRQPDQSEITVPVKEKKFKGYFKIARHYGWALNQTFLKFNFSSAIIIEDDLDVSPDIFSYFIATRKILLNDPTLWCVSAWNDNGKIDLININAPELLHRTDFFPGLGWMLTRQVWEELSVKWPASYWDDWIRKPEQRKGRACIRPEISRTRTFGKIGVSNGLFYEKHLKYIHLNEKYVQFTKMNLSHLLKDNYDSNFVKEVYESPIVTQQELKAGSILHSGSVRIPYHNKGMYKATAKTLGLMDDFRSGVPRGSYRGVVTFFYKNRRVYVAPSAKWNGYDPSWS